MPASGLAQAVTVFAKRRKNAAISPKPLWQALGEGEHLKSLAVHCLLIGAGVVSVIATFELNRSGDIFLSASIIFVICGISAVITSRTIGSKILRAVIVYTIGVSVGETSFYLYWYFKYAIEDPVAYQASLGVSVSIIEALYIVFVGVVSLILGFIADNYAVHKLRKA